MYEFSGRQMQIVVTNQIIYYDWNKNERSTYFMSKTADCKKGYVTKDANGREIGITYEADDKTKVNIVHNAYMLFFKKYKDELGKYRLVKTKFDKPFLFSKLEEILETQDEFDDLQIEI